MRINENEVLLGERVILVPYLDEHVERYHQWMQDPDLRELTASELLTLKEEYAMQKSWHSDENKLTFIVLERTASLNAQPTLDECTTLKMLGDVNLFINDDEGEKVGEVELMIAEHFYRGKGYGREILEVFIDYTRKKIDIKTLVVKISFDNEVSINLFRKLGFKHYKIVEIFQEVEMRLLI